MSNVAFQSAIKTFLTAMPVACRQAARVGTKMLSMAVYVDQLRVTDNDTDYDDAEADAESQVTRMTRTLIIISKFPPTALSLHSRSRSLAQHFV